MALLFAGSLAETYFISTLYAFLLECLQSRLNRHAHLFLFSCSIQYSIVPLPHLRNFWSWSQQGKDFGNIKPVNCLQFREVGGFKSMPFFDRIGLAKKWHIGFDDWTRKWLIHCDGEMVSKWVSERSVPGEILSTKIKSTMHVIFANNHYNIAQLKTNLLLKQKNQSVRVPLPSLKQSTTMFSAKCPSRKDRKTFRKHVHKDHYYSFIFMYILFMVLSFGPLPTIIVISLNINFLMQMFTRHLGKVWLI